jgi:hypothetical protein
MLFSNSHFAIMNWHYTINFHQFCHFCYKKELITNHTINCIHKLRWLQEYFHFTHRLFVDDTNGRNSVAGGFCLSKVAQILICSPFVIFHEVLTVPIWIILSHCNSYNHYNWMLGWWTTGSKVKFRVMPPTTKNIIRGLSKKKPNLLNRAPTSQHRWLATVALCSGDLKL